jgi:heat-inducible transcriptional repressor
MTDAPQLSPRALEILNSIVQSYIQTGLPVASRSVSRLRHQSLSAATIRNVMADLSDEGYLEQPHTSAGRVPTAKAFQLFTRSLTAKAMLDAELDRLRAELGTIGTVAGRIERTSHVLTEMTHGFGIAAAIPTESQTLEQVELLQLADGRILMIVVTRDKMVRNRVISLKTPVTQDELFSIRNYINQSFSGWVLSDVRQELEKRLEEASAAYDEILKKLVFLYDQGLLDLEVGPEIHTEGVSNLVGIEFHLTNEKMRELFRALEEEKRVLELLDQFLAAPADRVSIQVGLGEAHPSMSELSLIGISVALPSGLGAKIAVLGPMRMNYQKVMSAVLNVSQAIKSVPV